MAQVQVIQPYQPQSDALEKVAAYCRVSTDSSDQQGSYQKSGALAVFLRNIQFMVSRGFARTAEGPEALAALAAALLSQPEVLAAWREKLAAEFDGSAAQIICEEICRDFGIQP